MSGAFGSMDDEHALAINISGTNKRRKSMTPHRRQRTGKQKSTCATCGAYGKERTR